jgi:hypothetical protein
MIHAMSAKGLGLAMRLAAITAAQHQSRRVQDQAGDCAGADALGV